MKDWQFGILMVGLAGAVCALAFGGILSTGHATAWVGAAGVVVAFAVYVWWVVALLRPLPPPTMPKREPVVSDSGRIDS